MEIIEAGEQHIPAIQKIYAWHVLHGTASFETQPPDEREMTGRLKRIKEAGLLWLVVLHEDEVKGYCYLGHYRERYAYRHTLEDSIYIDPAFQKRGAGKALLRRAIDWAETHGYRQLIGNVSNVVCRIPVQAVEKAQPAAGKVGEVTLRQTCFQGFRRQVSGDGLMGIT